MSEPDFGVTVESAWLVKVAGELDLATVDQFAAALDRPGWVTVDCTDLTFMDSSGIRALVVARQEAEERGAGLSIVGLNGAALKVMEMAGVLEGLRTEHSPGRPVATD